MTSGEHKSSVLGGIIGATISVLVTLLVIEILFRVVVPENKHTGWSDRPYAYFMPSDSPNLQDYRVPTKNAGTFRIAVIGDSFTFGPHMQFEYTFSKGLERLLNLNKGSKKVEVINQGVCGDSTRTEVYRTKAALELQPDLIILEITLNDAEPKILTPAEKSKLYDAPYLDWPIFKTIKSFRFILERLHNSTTVRNYIDYHTKFFKSPETFAVFNKSLSEIKKITAENQIPLVAAVFPLFDFKIDQNYPLRESHQIINAALKQNNIPEIPLIRAFKKIPPERLQVIPGKDNHPNEIAHRIAAEYILASLVKYKLIPESNIPQNHYARRTERQEQIISDTLTWSRPWKRLETSSHN
jgi:lysophospholipase L1-like esterase